MAVVLSNPQFVNQQGSSPFNQPYVNQLNAGQMAREVSGWNPSVDHQTALRFVNETYRQILDMRSWYGTKIRGQIATLAPYSQGSVTATTGSNSVTGNGTGWTLALVGQQFRLNFTYALQNIVDIDEFNQILFLDMPWAGPTQTSGYQILQSWFELEANIKRFLWAVNQEMGWQMKVNALPVECINYWDTWRTSLGWSTHVVTRPPSPAGNYQIEVWPPPFQKQVIPFEAYTVPPDMEEDSDSPVPFIRSDVIVKGASAKALLYRPKQNTYYDVQSAIAVARELKQEYVADIETMMLVDNGIDQRDVMWEPYGTGDEDVFPGGQGSTWVQSHE